MRQRCRRLQMVQKCACPTECDARSNSWGLEGSRCICSRAVGEARGPPARSAPPSLCQTPLHQQHQQHPASQQDESIQRNQKQTYQTQQKRLPHRPHRDRGRRTRPAAILDRAADRSQRARLSTPRARSSARHSQHRRAAPIRGSDPSRIGRCSREGPLPSTACCSQGSSFCWKKEGTLYKQTRVSQARELSKWLKDG